MESWNRFCYSPVVSETGRGDGDAFGEPEFVFWKNGDFGLCFEHVFVLSLTHSLLATVSGAYIGLKHTAVKRKLPSAALLARGVLMLLLLLNSLVEFLGSFWLVQSRPYSVVLSQSTAILAWSAHALSLIVLSRSPFHTGFGPVPLNLSWASTLLSSIIRFRTVVKHVECHSAYPCSSDVSTDGYLSSLQQVTGYVQFGLQIVYLVLLAVPARKPTSLSIKLTPPRAGSTQYHDEDDPLLVEDNEVLVTSRGTRGQYGSLRPHPSIRRFRIPDASEDRANFLSLLSFWWLQPLMERGSQGLLQRPVDLPALPKSIKTAVIRERFQWFLNRPREQSQLLTSEGQQSMRSLNRLSLSQNDGLNSPDVPHNINSTSISPSPSRPVSLVWSLNKSFGLHYYPLGLIKLFNDCLGFGGPLLLHQLVSFMENGTEPMSHGYYYALGLFLSTLLAAILNAHFTYQVNKVCLKVRAALVTEVFRKSLHVSAVNMAKFSTGQVVNYMSTDTDRIVNFGPSFHQFWSLPFQIAVSLYLLYRQVGLAFLAGLVFSILLIPINRWLAKKIGQLSTTMMSQKDSRVKLMTEILMGIRVIKFYAWERNFSDRINEIRNAELKSLAGRKYLDALCVYFWATTPVLISILTFSTYVALGNKLTAAKVFTSLALFNMLISPLNAFPWVLNGLVEAWVSVKRVQKFLLLPEIDPSQYYVTEGVLEGQSLNEQSSELISVSSGSFTWKRDEERAEVKSDDSTEENTQVVEWLLKDVDLNVRKGSFIGVTGKVGAGKTSLFAAITAEMRKIQGQVHVADLEEGFGLAAQEPWIQFATVRDNILFGLPYDMDKYSDVLHACALEEDLKILPAGDLTEVGENGVTLSGGQKARIALARAVYQDKEVYLLDDPLAAVDAHVATHLYTHCIMGLLRRKTRILCTHHIRFLQETDCVIVLTEGAITLVGPPATVLPLVDGHEQRRQPRRHGIEGHVEGRSEKSPSPLSLASEDERPEGDGILVKEEEKEEGVVKVSVYWAYWRAVGMFLAPAIILSLFLMQASRNISDWWLAFWISHTSNGSSVGNVSSYLISVPVSTDSSPHLSFYLGIYGGLAGANTLFTLVRAFLYAYGGIHAAKVIHKKLFSAILRAPVWFFDITPIGRIINRFSSDLYAIDDSLPFILNILLAQLFGLFGTLVITSYGLPWFMVLLVPLAIIYYYIQKYYRRTSRELKRLSTVTLSPVYAHFQETLTGLWTIRALRASQRFMKENEDKLEMSQRANYASYAIAQWLSIRLQMLGVAMVGGVAFIAVLEHHFAGSVDPGLVGLAISYALSVTNLLSGVVTSFTETEKEMVSVERAMQYIEGTPAEGTTRAAAGSPPSSDWPSRGVIEFKRVVLKYREGLPPALKGVTLLTKPAEKIGVVGRTGAGKSSLFQALFRMTDPLESGTILIDDVNIAELPLDVLRSAMAIIPQDPFLFNGTVKENLDPCNKCSSYDLWSALERCHLKTVVQNMGGLNAVVEDRGREFSAGQRQLVCLARALLTNSKIICIDEATASVDLSTDAQIQQTIRTEFVTSTVITIAHRIETVLNCDRIIVMEGGRVKEFDNPGVLLGDPNSIFSSLFNEYKSKGRK